MEEDLNMISGDWNFAQEIFGRLPQKDIAKIRFRTRSLLENEVLQEWKGAPTALKSYITSSNDRVENVTLPPIESPSVDSAKGMLYITREYLREGNNVCSLRSSRCGWLRENLDHHWLLHDEGTYLLSCKASSSSHSCCNTFLGSGRLLQRKVAAGSDC